MLATCTLLLFSLAGLRAQSNTEYNFSVSSNIDGASFAGDPVPKLSMGCLAANGYGQWTLSSVAGAGSFTTTSGTTTTGASEFPAGWYLLENALREPSTKFVTGSLAHPGCIPSGVVQCGTFSSSVFNAADPKATADLDGWINYVSPHSTDGGVTFTNSFDVLYFRTANVDLSASFCTNHPDVGNMNLISTTSGSINTATISTKDASGTFHPVISSESDFRDEFDVSSDAHFIYVVWESLNVIDGHTKEIWANFIQLGTSSSGTGTAFKVGNGHFPTIACDARNNRIPSNALYDIAYINSINQPVDVSFINTTGTNFFINPLFIAPFGWYACDVCSEGSEVTSVTHVRAVVSEIAGASTDRHGMYVIGFAYLASAASGSGGGIWSGTDEGLFLYPNLTTTSSSQYLCDGPMLPTPSLQLLAGASLLDEPITAFCDPYDNQNGNGYDGFHCVYRTNAMSSNMADTAVVPLMIMQAYYNAATYYPTAPDTRLLLTQNGDETLLADPHKGYVAAVNQMGIHVHWRTTPETGSGPDIHFYARDMNRTFDEDIEENTLVTGLCTITDGSSTGTNHGGTVGAMILPGKSMLVWTDPNYGADPFVDALHPGNTNSGLYQPVDIIATDLNPWWQSTPQLYDPPVGTLRFSIGQTTAIKLQVGDGSFESDATLTVMPNFYILFPSSSQGYGMSVQVNGGSTFSYYGLWGRRGGATFSYGDLDWTLPNLTYGSAQITQAYSTRDGEGLIDLEGGSTENPANLIVHDGANFQIGEDTYFRSYYGNIDIRNGEGNIYPLRASGANSPASGIMTFEGQAFISYSTVTSHMPGWGGVDDFRSAHAVIHVPGSWYGDASETSEGAAYARPYGAFYSQNSVYTNTDNGLGVILFDQLPLDDGQGLLSLNPFEDYQDVNSNYDNFNGVELTAIDPQNTYNAPDNVFNITNGGFAGVPNISIDIERQTPLASPFYGKNIFISNNTFTGSGFSELPYGYFIDALGLNLNIDSLSKLTVESNTLNDVPNGVKADIWFDASDGLIGSNIIIGNFLDGINITGYTTPGYDPSFLCDNNISGGGDNSTGLQTSNYQGYIKLNKIYSGSGSVWWGWTHSLGGIPHLFCSQIYGCVINGIQVNSTVDLSGLHHPGGSGDIAGFNQVYDNVGPQINITSTTGGPNVWVNEYEISSTWQTSNGGMNDIYQTLTGGSVVLINGDAYSNTPTLDISNNFWGTGITPPSNDPSTTYWPGFKFTSTSALLTATSIPGDVTCSDGLLAKKKGSNPQSILQLDGDSCDNAIGAAYDWYQNGYNYGPAYDTMKWYIRHCYKTADAGQTWGTFGGSLDSVNQTFAGRTDVSNFALYALSLRNDDDWFCLGIPFLGDQFDTQDKVNYPPNLTILKFLINNPRCTGNIIGDSIEYKNMYTTWFMGFQDTGHIGDVFDSTLPTLHQLGLDTLLKFAAASDVHYQALGTQIIGNASIMPNPTLGQATVSLSIEREAYVHIEVFDLLGEKENGIGYEGVFETGQYTTPLDLRNLPAGSYYIRITTANNEVRTLKLVKE